MPKLKGALFDIDGVTVNSEPLYFEAVQRTFADYGIMIGENEYVRRYMLEQTTSAGVIADYGLRDTLENIRDKKLAILVELMEDGLAMMPGAMELLDYLGKNIPLGAVTSADRREMVMKLGKFGLEPRFKVIVTGDDVTNTKPDPEPYELGVSKLGATIIGLRPEEVLAVEDTPSGAKSAKGAGCRVIAYPNGYTLRMDFTGVADRVVYDLGDINDGLLAPLFPD